MKKLLFLLLFMLLATNIKAENAGITLTFTAKHNGTHIKLDSILVENLTQYGIKVLYDPDTVLKLTPTYIDIIDGGYNDLFVSQNYPNPFSEKTYFDLYVPERDLFSLDVYDLTGRKVTSYEITLERGIHHFTFHACNLQSYLLTVSSNNYMQKRLMIQIRKGSRSSSKITYTGLLSQTKTQQLTSETDFPFEPGDEFKFTGYVTSDFGNVAYDVITDIPETDTDYIFDISFPRYTLTLEAEPHEGGTVEGGGDYDEGQEVNITANANNCYDFINWTDEENNVFSTDASFIYIMPAEDVTLTANFNTYDGIPGDGVTDIDGNFYQTVCIGGIEWMAENLRTATYNNGIAIPGGLSNSEWVNTNEGAYAVYPHEDVDGIDSEAEMVEAYGKLYNWYGVDDSRGLCPAGWYVPSDEDWDDFLDYLKNEHGIENTNTVDGAGNALKSCRQVDSPLGGECATSEHPRWDFNNIHYGTDEFGFSALPGGSRGDSIGGFLYMGYSGSWWGSTESDTNLAWFRSMACPIGSVYRSQSHKRFGYSVRCARNID